MSVSAGPHLEVSGISIESSLLPFVQQPLQGSAAVSISERISLLFLLPSAADTILPFAGQHQRCQGSV